MHNDYVNYIPFWDDQYEDNSADEYCLRDDVTDEDLLENKYAFRAEWFQYVENFYN